MHAVYARVSTEENRVAQAIGDRIDLMQLTDLASVSGALKQLISPNFINTLGLEIPALVLAAPAVGSLRTHATTLLKWINKQINNMLTAVDAETAALGRRLCTLTETLGAISQHKPNNPFIEMRIGSFRMNGLYPELCAHAMPLVESLIEVAAGGKRKRRRVSRSRKSRKSRK